MSNSECIPEHFKVKLIKRSSDNFRIHYKHFMEKDHKAPSKLLDYARIKDSIKQIADNKFQITDYS